MSASTVRCRAFADAEKAIAEATADIGADRPGATAAERRVFGIATEHARVALTEIAKAPLEVTLHWPSGVDHAARQTIEAQLHEQLQRAAHGRLKLELIAIFGLAPAILRSLAEWAAEGPESPQATRHRWPLRRHR